jgi:hypothetical protein
MFYLSKMATQWRAVLSNKLTFFVKMMLFSSFFGSFFPSANGSNSFFQTMKPTSGDTILPQKKLLAGVTPMPVFAKSKECPININTITATLETGCNTEDGQLKIEFSDISTVNSTYSIQFEHDGKTRSARGFVRSPIILKGLPAGDVVDFVLYREADGCMARFSQAVSMPSPCKNIDPSSPNFAARAGCATTGSQTILDCNGVNITVQNSALTPSAYIALHGNNGQIATGNGLMPACMSFVSASCLLESPNYVFCCDFTKSSGIPTTWPIGTITWTPQQGIAGVTSMSPLKAARIAWIFDNFAALGYSMSLAADRRKIQQAVWNITNPTGYTCNSGDAWYNLCNGANTAITSAPVQPTLAMTAAATSTFTTNSIMLTLVTNQNSVILKASDLGGMPILCNGSQSQPGWGLVDNGNGTGTLTITGSGDRTVFMCLTRNVPTTNLRFSAEFLAVYTDGSEFTMLIPSLTTIQPMFIPAKSYLHPIENVFLNYVCDPFTAGGTIAASQILCNATDPAAFTNSVSPSGGNGTIDYEWRSFVGASAPVSFTSGTVISGATGLVYDASSVTSKTWFTRVSRKGGAGCTQIESNWVSVLPIQFSVTATNTGPVCPTANITLNGGQTGGTAPITWSWTGPQNYKSAAQNNTFKLFSSLFGGNFTLLATDANGCTASQSTNVTVNPVPNPPGTISY